MSGLEQDEILKFLTSSPNKQQEQHIETHTVGKTPVPATPTMSAKAKKWLFGTVLGAVAVGALVVSTFNLKVTTYVGELPTGSQPAVSVDVNKTNPQYPISLNDFNTQETERYSDLMARKINNRISERAFSEAMDKLFDDVRFRVHGVRKGKDNVSYNNIQTELDRIARNIAEEASKAAQSTTMPDSTKKAYSEAASAIQDAIQKNIDLKAAKESMVSGFNKISFSSTAQASESTSIQNMTPAQVDALVSEKLKELRKVQDEISSLEKEREKDKDAKKLQELKNTVKSQQAKINKLEKDLNQGLPPDVIESFSKMADAQYGNAAKFEEKRKILKNSAVSSMNNPEKMERLEQTMKEINSEHGKAFSHNDFLRTHQSLVSKVMTCIDNMSMDNTQCKVQVKVADYMLVNTSIDAKGFFFGIKDSNGKIISADQNGKVIIDTEIKGTKKPEPVRNYFVDDVSKM